MADMADPFTNSLPVVEPSSLRSKIFSASSDGDQTEPLMSNFPPESSPGTPLWSRSLHRTYPTLLTIVCTLAAALALSYVFPSPSLEPHGSVIVARHLEVLDKPMVILVSSDGFRWGYNHKARTPNIDRLRVNGTEAETGMIPVYPTLTFPNHYSIATGLYPAWHGIIANYFSDPSEEGGFFARGNLDPKWWLGEPIWETVVKNGLHAAGLFWPGSEVHKGPWKCPAKYCPHYNESVPFEERVDTVLGYLDLPAAERPSFVALYFEAPDKPGHETGPDAPQITDAVVRVDAMMGRLLDGLEERNVLQDVTIIMVGDHGMVGNCGTKMIYWEDLAPWIDIPAHWIDSYSPILAIRPPHDVDVKEVFAKISEALSSGAVNNGEFLDLYLKEDLPARLHYSDSPRIQPIIGMVAEGYKVAPSRSRKAQCGGSHGYDNAYLSMRTIFIGSGPQFAPGRKVESFHNVELYHVMTSILGLKSAPHNGTASFAKSLLLPAPS